MSLRLLYLIMIRIFGWLLLLGLRALALVDVPARVTILHGMGRPSRLLVDLAAGDERVQVTGIADPIPAG